jgi:hypothetical protein
MAENLHVLSSTLLDTFLGYTSLVSLVSIVCIGQEMAMFWPAPSRLSPAFRHQLLLNAGLFARTTMTYIWKVPRQYTELDARPKQLALRKLILHCHLVLSSRYPTPDSQCHRRKVTRFQVRPDSTTITSCKYAFRGFLFVPFSFTYLKRAESTLGQITGRGTSILDQKLL